jgi:hypothetical protein
VTCAPRVTSAAALLSVIGVLGPLPSPSAWAALAGRAPDIAQDRARPDKPTAAATRISSTVRIDGVLDDDAWKSARPIGPLVQAEPKEGAPATEETEVRILYDLDTLYVAILCRDRTPSGIVSTQLTRDAQLEVDDMVTVIVDPFLDERNGFFFQVNPAGARADGQVSNNAEWAGLDWDGIWDASARITGDGWTAELAIPFKTLRFKPGQATWGLNVERRIKRLNEVDRWSAPRQNVWLSNLAEAGRLEGLVGIRQGLGLDLRPYGSLGREGGSTEAQGGIDIFKNLTPNVMASVTVNTDFAETEVDERQINLTRFPLFFPEKRAFFLEGAGVFEIAGMDSFHGDLVPFFTRRIGLLRGDQVPIGAGVKVVGRQSGFNVGVLDVQTRDLDTNPDAGQNLLAARVSRNIFRQSWIGGIVTRGNPTGAGQNALLGADARLATSEFRGGKNLSLDIYVLRTDDEATGTVDYAGGFKIEYPNDLWHVLLDWKQIGEDFRPALGFVPRTGFRRTSAGISFMPRPHKWGIRQFFFNFWPQYITDLENQVQNWNVMISPVNFELDSGDRFELSFGPEFERLPEPFEITDGNVLAPGSYQWNRWAVEVGTASKRWWVVSLDGSWGGFYEGTRSEIQLDLTFKPSTHLAFGLELERNDISLPTGDFITHVLAVKGDYNFSPNVSWANLIQYDNESRLLGMQSRFRWILKPGSDLFIVLNRGWYQDLEGNYHRLFDRGSAKLQYTFRF